MVDSLLPRAVHARLAAFAAEHVRRAPELLDRLIVTGSAIADDWWNGVSDIDLILIIRRAPTADEITTLRELHRSTIAEGPVDGVYLTEEQLSGGPDGLREAPQVVDGELDSRARGAQLSWITWREIETGVEGTVVASGNGTGDVTVDIRWAPSSRIAPGSADGARAFSRQNLGDYWKPLGAQLRTQLSARGDDDPVDPVTLRWIVLGPARLVATIETGEVISKTAAAAFAAESWPEHAALLARAVDSRRGRSITFTAADAREALDLLDRCVEVAEPESPRPETL